MKLLGKVPPHSDQPKLTETRFNSHHLKVGKGCLLPLNLLGHSILSLHKRHGRDARATRLTT
jgi:hypothetical protein